MQLSGIFKPERYRYSAILLRQLVVTDFKLRYQGSVLGYLWSLLKPLAMFAILYIVFSVFLRVGEGIDNFPVYLLLGVVLWSFFAEVATSSMLSIAGRGDLLRKINFPKYVVVLSSAFSSLINLFFNMTVVLIFAFFSGVDFGWRTLLVFPLTIELFIFSLAVGFLLSSLYVRFRDINFIWEVVQQGAFYATPILYPLYFVPPFAAKIIMLSPMAQIIQDYRYVLVTKQTTVIGDLYSTWLIWAVPISATLLILLFSGWLFKKESLYFAERV